MAASSNEGDKGVVAMLRAMGELALDFVYPPRCAVCGVFGPDGLCEPCAEALGSPQLQYQSGSSRGEIDLAFAYHYSSVAGEMVRMLKYERITSLARPMAKLLAQAVEGSGLDACDYIVPVPLHWSKRCRRGFNQTELLVEAMPRELVDLKLLKRVRATPPLAKQSIEDRIRILDGAFQASESVAGKSCLLVDDILTSGATLRECAKALKAAGADAIHAVAFAGTA